MGVGNSESIVVNSHNRFLAKVTEVTYLQYQVFNLPITSLIITLSLNSQVGYFCFLLYLINPVVRLDIKIIIVPIPINIIVLPIIFARAASGSGLNVTVKVVGILIVHRHELAIIKSKSRIRILWLKVS